MRTMRVRWLAALFVAATSACGESVGPEASARDLDFVVPMGLAVGEIRQEMIESPFEEPADLPSSVDGGQGQLPFIWDVYAKGSFDGMNVVFEYGLLGFGSSYSMKPRIDVIGADGRMLRNEEGLGRSESLPFPTVMRPSSRESRAVESSCGATATLGVYFEVRLDVAGKPMLSNYKESRSVSDIFYQSVCPPQPPTTSSGGSGERFDDSGVWLCWYEVWYDVRGRILAMVELSCTKLEGNEM